MTQSNELGLGPWACPRTLASPRRQRGLGDLRHKPYHGRQKKKVWGGIPPRTLKIRSKFMFKSPNHTPQTCDKEENSKYLSKSCHHYIKCTTTTFLAVLMWRRPLNSDTLATTTHKGLKEVCDGIGAQVKVWMINKCKAQMIRKSIYNV